MTYNTLHLLAPAKLNLFLHITGVRDDGYHFLQSLMVFLDIGDNITVAPHDTLFIDVTGRFASTEILADPRHNIVYKTALALAQEFNVQPRARIVLEKKLPVAAGLGGGSSDAATTLTALAKLWGLPDERHRLEKVARTLGADVPACLVRQPVWAEGIGDVTTRLTGMPDMHFVLVNPGHAIHTTEVFRILRRRHSPKIQFTGRRKTMGEWIADLTIYRNDLTDAASEICPAIPDVLSAIAATPHCRFARLSGSGATCFGVYETVAAAKAAENKLRGLYPHWWVKLANLSNG